MPSDERNRVAHPWRAWTRKEIDKLESLRLEGLGLAGCAAALGRTYHSVRNQAAGLPRASKAAAYMAAFSGPHTIPGVAAAFGVTASAVRQQKRKLRRAGFGVRAADRGTR